MGNELRYPLVLWEWGGGDPGPAFMALEALGV